MSRPIRILEMRSVRGTGGGPEKTILMGAGASDPRRFSITVCYIRDRRDEGFGVTARAREAAVDDYVEVLERHSFDPAIWGKLRRLIADRGIHLVHSHDYKTNLIAWLLWRTTGIGILSTVHGWTGHSPRERLVYYPCDKWLLARFPRAIAVSTDIKNELVRHGAREERIAVILNGIDDGVFRRDRAQSDSARASLHLSNQDVVIGAVGRLELQKRFDLLLRAFASLRRDAPALKLVVAGDGSQREALHALSRQLGVDDHCRWSGHVSDVARLHHAFDLFVQSSDYEGTPNAVLEAMALETPIVATDAGGTAELLTDGVEGIVVARGDGPQLEAAMSRLLQDRRLAAQMAAAARRRVERELSFAARMRKVEAIYEGLVPLSSGGELLAGFRG
jgi:glycosyltransferase involved in cell wall biosynthesis